MTKPAINSNMHFSALFYLRSIRVLFMGSTSRYLLFIIFFFLACSYQQAIVLQPVNLPEEIYTSPPIKDYEAYKVGLFRFTEPVNSPGTGKTGWTVRMYSVRMLLHLLSIVLVESR